MNRILNYKKLKKIHERKVIKYCMYIFLCAHRLPKKRHILEDPQPLIICPAVRSALQRKLLSIAEMIKRGGD